MGTKKSILFLLCALLITPLLPALNTSYSAQPHSGDVLAMAALPDGSGFFSAGKDGFLVKWDDSSNGDHYQVSEIQVKLIAVHPTKNEVAIYETDNFTIHRVSLWNWKTKTRKFSKKFSHAVVSLAFSAKGTWLMTGTSSMDGLMFLDPNSGNQKNILKQQPGIVPLTFTNAAESTLITYAQTGRITYTDLKTGEVKASFATTPNLTQTVLHNNNLYLSGVSNNTIYTINATTGGVISEKAEPQPMLVTASSDKEVRYIARDRRQYRFMDSTAGILGVFTIAEEMPEITAYAVAGGLIYYLGAKNGEIYTILPTEDSPIMETSQARLSAVTANNRMPVLDIASESLWFYLLTAEGVFRTAQSGRERIELVYPCTDVQNITYTEGGIVLWSKNQVAPLVLVSLNGGGNAVELYTPVLPLTSITAHNNKLVIVEAMDRVTIFDLTEKKSVFSYNGTGFQDAILLDDNSLYISRSAGIGSSSIITINITTSETVMLPVESNIAFALTEMPGQSIGTQFFGFLVSVSGTSQKTELYDFNTRTARYKPIAVWADEDLNAFVYPTDRYIYTNLGKANVMIIDRRNGRQYRMARAAALPRKLMASRQSLLVLNTDGSLSWYRRGNNTHAGDWFLDMENNWVSY